MHANGGRGVVVLLVLLALVPWGSACTQGETEGARPAPGSTPVVGSRVAPSPTPVAATSTPASSTTPSDSTPGAGRAAPRRRISVSDPEGDVDDAPRPSHWLVPGVDLSGFEVTYEATSRRLRFRIEFADLRRLEDHHGLFSQSITVASDADPGRTVYFERSSLERDSLVSRTVAPMLHDGSTTRRCPRAGSHVDLESDVVLISVPVRCVTRVRRPARFSVWTSGGQRFEDRQGWTVGTDLLEAGRRVRTR
ncbi:hypothetical protein [Nocardioides sp. W7]|uniref:hypothetical protein n=1 Tax=Nocardioides sp. W7 TaxID=2931390 RepID=UPI001FD03F9B|nr:hypothetical protein [Nocardioides sp. W7]